MTARSGSVPTPAEVPALAARASRRASQPQDSHAEMQSGDSPAGLDGQGSTLESPTTVAHPSPA